MKMKMCCVAVASLVLITGGLFLVSTLQHSQKVAQQTEQKSARKPAGVVSNVITLTGTADVTIEK